MLMEIRQGEGTSCRTDVKTGVKPKTRREGSVGNTWTEWPSRCAGLLNWDPAGKNKDADDEL